MKKKSVIKEELKDILRKKLLEGVFLIGDGKHPYSDNRHRGISHTFPCRLEEGKKFVGNIAFPTEKGFQVSVINTYSLKEFKVKIHLTDEEKMICFSKSKTDSQSTAYYEEIKPMKFFSKEEEKNYFFSLFWKEIKPL